MRQFQQFQQLLIEFINNNLTNFIALIYHLKLFDRSCIKVVQKLVDKLPDCLKIHNYIVIRFFTRYLHELATVFAYYNPLLINLGVEVHIAEEYRKLIMDKRIFTTIISKVPILVYIIDSSKITNLLDLAIESLCRNVNVCSPDLDKSYRNHSIYEYLLKVLDSIDEMITSIECATPLNKLTQFMDKENVQYLTNLITLFKIFFQVYKDLNEDNLTTDFNFKELEVTWLDPYSKFYIDKLRNINAYVFSFAIKPQSNETLKIWDVIKSVPFTAFRFINFEKMVSFAMSFHSMYSSDSNIIRHKIEITYPRGEIVFEELLKSLEVVLLKNFENIIKNIIKIRICNEIFQMFV